MPKGGHARSGPPPDPNALRRDRKNDTGWTHLPAERTGPVPDWPLTRPSARESALWAAEWRRPQAAVWEANGQQLEVAVYVRTLVAAERPGATAPVRTLLRQQMDALGLTIPGLLRNRWVIGGQQPAPTVARIDDPDRTSARARFEVLLGNAEAG